MRRTARSLRRMETRSRQHREDLDLLLRAVDAAEEWYGVQRGTMAAQSPTGLRVRDALIEVRSRFVR